MARAADFAEWCWAAFSAARACPGRPGLALERNELLEHLVAGCDHSAVRLETALGHDHAREFLREIDVRHLERAAGDRRLRALERESEHRAAGVAGRRVHVVAHAEQTVRVVEVRED